MSTADIIWWSLIVLAVAYLWGERLYRAKRDSLRDIQFDNAGAEDDGEAWRCKRCGVSASEVRYLGCPAGPCPMEWKR